MQPTHAEVARTLAAGHLPATAHIACRPGPYPVRHVTDAQGRVLLLSPRNGALTAALRPTRGHRRHRARPRHRRRAAGRRRAVAGPRLGRRLGRSRSTATRPARPRSTTPTPTRPPTCSTSATPRSCTAWTWPRCATNATACSWTSTRTSTPKPPPTRCAPIEFDLIADLADHHVEEMSDYVRRQLGPAARPGDEPRVVRLDRYGFMVRLGDRLARLAFPRPVTDRHDLAHLLHPVLCHRCTSEQHEAA